MPTPPDTRILQVRIDGDPPGLVRPPPTYLLHTAHPLPLFYDIAFEYVFEPGVPERRPREGTKAPRRCRVCPPDAGAQTYKKDAHIIPQALGNRALQTWEECDACNEHVGSPLEDALVKSLALVRALCPIKSKAGKVVSHRPGRKAFVSNREVDGERRSQVLMAEGDPSIQVRRDTARQTVTYAAELQPFSPLAAMRALGRMGYLALPSNSVPRYDHVRRWIRGEDDYLPTYTRMFVPGPSQKKSWLRVWEQRSELDGYPALVVEYMFGINAFYLYLPQSTMTVPTVAPLPVVTLSPYPPYEPQVQFIRVDSPAVASKPQESLTMGYTDVEERNLTAAEFEQLFGFPPE